jgi:flagellar basal-body rod protein FlgG
MIRSLWSAATGMNAQQLNLDVISNNLANVNSIGFKKSRSDFEDLMYQTLRAAGAQTSTGNEIPTSIQVGLGTRAVDVEKIFSQGTFQETSNQLDLAIEGKGFFKVLRNNEEVYTRAGAFKIDSNGNVTDPLGNQLQPAVTIPSGTVDISIDQSGSLAAVGLDGSVIGTAQLLVYDFPNPAGLHSIGHNLYRPTPSTGAEISGQPGTNGLGSISQGFLEKANVSVVEEMVAMIVAQRAYETNSKAIQSADQMLQMANNLKR